MLGKCSVTSVRLRILRFVLTALYWLHFDGSWSNWLIRWFGWECLFLDSFHFFISKSFWIFILLFPLTKHFYFFIMQHPQLLMRSKVIIRMENRISALQMVSIFKRLLSIEKHNSVIFISWLMTKHGLTSHILLRVMSKMVSNMILVLHPRWTQGRSFSIN